MCFSCDSVRHLLAFERSSHRLTYFLSAPQIVFILKRDFTRRTRILSSKTFLNLNSSKMAVPTNINKNSVQTLPEEIQVKVRLIFT